MNKFNKKKLPIRHTSLGAEKAPQRSDEICSLKDQRVKLRDLEEGSGSKRSSISFEHPSISSHVLLSNSDRSAIRFPPAQQTQDD